MIRPQKNKWYEILLNWFLDRKFKQRFSSVNYFFDGKIDENKSLLVIGNHATWWDGFIMWQMNRNILHKRFYAMMLETQLKRFWYFKKIGCFSINPGSKSVLESLKLGADLLRNKENMLLFYPQGRFFSLFDENLKFNKGVDFLLNSGGQADILLYALFTDYGSNELPYLNIYLKLIQGESHLKYAELEREYRTFYFASKEKHIQFFVP